VGGMSKQFILRSVDIDSYIDIEDLLDKIEEIKKVYDSPKDFGISQNDYEMEITFESLETDREYESRLKREEREKIAEEKRKKDIEKKERAQLERLKKKYGDV
jgi:hypothetical protein